MRVLIVSHTYQTITHGPAKFLRRVLAAATKEELDITVLTEEPPPVPTPGVYPVHNHQWLLSLPLGKLKFSLNYQLNIRRLQREYGPFAVIVFNDGSSGLITALFPPRSTKTLGMINDDDYVSSRRTVQEKDERNWVHRGHFYLERLAARRFDRVVANSHYLADLLRGEYRLLKRPTVLYKSVNLQLPFTPRADFSAIIHLLFVKADHRRGGLAELVDAIGQLTEYQFRLSVVGPAERPAVTTGSLPTNLQIDFRGPLPHGEALQLMAKADIFCTPSRREGLGVANLEALALGTTVVATAVGGIPEVLDGGNNGYLAAACAPAAIATALRAAISAAPEERLAKARAGRRWVEDHFDERQMTQYFFRLLRRLHNSV